MAKYANKAATALSPHGIQVICLLQVAWDLHTILFVGCIPYIVLCAEHALSETCLALAGRKTRSGSKFGEIKLTCTFTHSCQLWSVMNFVSVEW